MEQFMAMYRQAFALPPGRALDICLKLQNSILEHRLMPGTKLSEDEIGEVFGVSRTVVRDALQALAHTGLITIEKYRGAFVAEPTIKEAQEVFEARSFIEPRVAGMAASMATSEDIQHLRDHLDQEAAAKEKDDKGTLLALSGLFHLTIAEITDQRVLISFVRSLISQSSLIIAIYWKRPETTCESHSHKSLVDAIAAHDIELTEEIMKSHLVDLYAGLELRQKTAPSLSLSEMLK